MTFPKNPHLSVILPVKNGLPHLKNAVEGMCAQTYTNFTLIVQDGLSTDGSLEYLRSVKAPFAIDIVSEHDGSLTIGYSRAMKRATGDLLVPAACDEVFDKDAFEQYVSWYQERPDAVFIYGGSAILTDDIARGEMRQVFQPPEFNFVDYVLQKMCPTAAGAYNRRVLGDALYLDESLKTCPDFELITRLALCFGSDKIITKRAITMSARGDDASMSFRPEAHMQFVRDKTTVIDRLMNGPLAPRFKQYFRNDFVFNLHRASAAAVYAIEGDTPNYAMHILEAEKCLPHTEELGRIAHQSRYLNWNEMAGGIEAIAAPPPTQPDEKKTRVTQVLSFNHFLMNNRWLELGAKLTRLSQGVEVETIKSPGISAMLPLDVAKLDFDKNWHWLYVQYRALSGHPALVLTGSLSSQKNIQDELRVMQNKVLEPKGYTETALLYIKPCTSAAFIVSNASGKDASRVALMMAAVVEMPKDISAPLSSVLPSHAQH